MKNYRVIGAILAIISITSGVIIIAQRQHHENPRSKIGALRVHGKGENLADAQRLDWLTAQFPNVFTTARLRGQDMQLSPMAIIHKTIDQAEVQELVEKHEDLLSPEIVEAIFSRWAQQRPMHALKATAKLSGVLNRLAAVDGISDGISGTMPENIKELFDWLLSNKPVVDEDHPIYVTVAREFAAACPNDAKSYTDKIFRLLDVNRRSLEAIVVQEIMRTLLEMDADASITWIMEEPTRMDILKISEFAILRYVAKWAPEFVMDHAKEHAYMRQRGLVPNHGEGSLAAAFASLGAKDYTAAVRRASEWKDFPREYKEILRTLGRAADNTATAIEQLKALEGPDGTTWIEILADEDPEEAAKQLDPAELVETGHKRAYSAVILRWAERNPAAAASWVDQFPECATRDMAQGIVASEWSRQDAEDAATWIASLPEGNGRDEAVGNFILAIRNDEPEWAWEWTETLPQGTKRVILSKMVLREWLRSDPPAARRAFAASSLPEDIKQKIAPALDKRR